MKIIKSLLLLFVHLITAESVLAADSPNDSVIGCTSSLGALAQPTAKTRIEPDLREVRRLRVGSNISHHLSDKLQRGRSILFPRRLNLAWWEDEASFGHCTRT